ncbi:MAG TPA: DUF559 domain-containing protein [Acetobacteraceae bacterium]|jgi:very-short-patch-repair endonuclease|nr:DUF559 domain-containing protein [Acetobacteraceae bacterium]
MANDRARDTRHPTAAEAVLWKLLRNRHLEGQKFRRQHPVGPFIADFAGLELRSRSRQMAASTPLRPSMPGHRVA